MFNDPSQDAARKLDRLSRELRSLRQRAADRSDDERFAYAQAIIESPTDVRDQFFEALETLVDRHTLPLVRIKTLQIFLELGAIEGAVQGQLPMGLTALASLGNIMRSSRAIDRLFVEQCLVEPLTPIVKKMSNHYFGYAVSEIVSWVRSTAYPDEFAVGLADCAKKLAALHQSALLRAQVMWSMPSDNPADWKSNRDNTIFSEVSEIITFTCRSPETAKAYMPELAIVLYTKMETFNSLRPNHIHSRFVYSPFKLIAAFAKACPAAAYFFAGPEWPKAVVGPDAYSFYQQLTNALKHNRMMKFLLERLNMLLWDDRDQGDVSKEEAANNLMAHHISALFSIVSHSEQAAREMSDEYGRHEAKIDKSYENNGPLAPYAVQLSRRAVHFAQNCPALAAACLQGVLLTTRVDKAGRALDRSGPIGELLNVVESRQDQRFSETVRQIQNVCKLLLTATNPTEDTKYALMNAVEIMGVYNVSPLSTEFNEDKTKNYDREAITFGILSETKDFVDDDVRLVAARCLATLKMSEFSQKEIQQMIELFSTIPQTIPASRFQVYCQLQFFMFRLTLYEAPTVDENGVTIKNVSQPGRVFRSLYAPEVAATIFALLERLVLEATTDNPSFWELRFMQSCVKFLMTGWIKYEIHADNLGQRPIDVMAAIIAKEQQRIQDLGAHFEEEKQRYFRLIREGRCVISEDELSQDADVDNSSYRLPEIRLKKYKGVSRAQLNYQHTFIEQTSLGARVSNLYPVVMDLRRIDIVAFRVIHQLANVIDGLTFVSSVTGMADFGFNEWNKFDPGKPVSLCDRDERRSFDGELATADLAIEQAAQGAAMVALKAAEKDAQRAERMNDKDALERALKDKEAAQLSLNSRSQTNNKEASKGLVTIRAPANTDTENEVLWNMYSEYRLYYYKSRPRAKHRMNQKSVFIPSEAGVEGVDLNDYMSDERKVALVAWIGNTPVAFICAAPYREPSSSSVYGKSGQTAIVRMYFHSHHHLAELKAIRQELMSQLSHSLWIRGYNTCRFNADRHEKSILGEVKATIDSASKVEAAAAAVSTSTSTSTSAADADQERENKEKEDADEQTVLLEGAEDAAGGKFKAGGEGKDKQSMYKWSLDNNIFWYNREHAFFVEHKMAQVILNHMLKFQTDAKIEEMKAQNKASFGKAVVKRYRSIIRSRMEEFGGQLTRELENPDGVTDDSATPATVFISSSGADDESGVITVGTTGVVRGADRESRFKELLEREFKNSMALNIKVAPPVWEKVLAGPREETLVEAMTRVPPVSSTAPKPTVAAALLSQLPPDLNPRTNPDNWPNQWLAEQLEATALAAADPLKSKDSADGQDEVKTTLSAEQREIELEVKARKRDIAEQIQARDADRKEAEARRKEWELPDILQSWTVPTSAAVLRILYALLTRSQLEAFETMCKDMASVPQKGLGMLETIRAVLSSFQYQLRGSVLEQFPPSNYSIAIKVLQMIEASLVDVPAGLEPALQALEYYELCLEIVKDIARLILSLLESRNSSYTAAASQGTATVPENALEGGSAIAKGELHPDEERTMFAMCRTLTVLMNQVGRVSLFRGSTAMIAQGNSKCRQHAQQQLFTKNKLLGEVLNAILLYDLEKESEAEPKEKTSAADRRKAAAKGDNSAKSSPEYRDMMRVHATNLLANFIYVDDEFRYSFFNDFCVSSIQAERSLRASLIQRVLGVSAMLRFKEKLEMHLRTHTKQLDLDESLVSATFTDHSTSADPSGVNFPGVKLLIVTSKAFLISTNYYPWDIEQNVLDLLKTEKLASFEQFERHNYRDIIRIYRDISGQVMAIRSFTKGPDERVLESKMTRETNIMLHRGQGVIDSIISDIAKRARDDGNRVHIVAADEYTPKAIPLVLAACLPDASRVTVRMMTYVHVMKRDATIVPRLMMWIQGSSADSQFIVITAYSLKHWKPHLAGENDDQIIPVVPWSTEFKEPQQRYEPGGITPAKVKAEDISLKGMFDVPPPSSLPSLFEVLPSLPVGNIGPTPAFFFPVSEIQSVDFTEDIETDMVIRIKRVEPSRIPSVYIRFTDDTGREMWRRKLKDEFYSGSFGTWRENLLPDLSEGSRRKQELL